MTPHSTGAARSERDFVAAARDGDEGAFAGLVEPYRGELHAHCYRMLGSLHDAEDALQDALLRAWRGLRRFEGRSSLRSWLYTIATNACLDAIGRRRRRVLPIDYGPAADPHGGAGEPLIESVWVEPYPDDQLGLADGFAAPAARYERRESVELAFIAALQHLPGNQRAVLILREVLGFSAAEVAESLDTTVASVNSALQRARKSVDERLPDESQQATLRTLGDDELRELVENYIDAMEQGDVDRVVAMLAEDAAWSMPPLASYFQGRDALTVFLAKGPMSGKFRWRYTATRANGQPAIAGYTWHEEDQAYLPFALDVLTLRGDKIEQVTAFIARGSEISDREVLARWPDTPVDAVRAAWVFERFGLPPRLEQESRPA
jgi:RNA polymerase sigma-70 factor (ECF subfamily)